MKGAPRHTLSTSMMKYRAASSRNPVPAINRMNDKDLERRARKIIAAGIMVVADQRFLLSGITPLFLLAPHNATAMPHYSTEEWNTHTSSVVTSTTGGVSYSPAPHPIWWTAVVCASVHCGMWWYAQPEDRVRWDMPIVYSCETTFLLAHQENRSQLNLLTLVDLRVRTHMTGTMPETVITKLAITVCVCMCLFLYVCVCVALIYSSYVHVCSQYLASWVLVDMVNWEEHFVNVAGSSSGAIWVSIIIGKSSRSKVTPIQGVSEGKWRDDWPTICSDIIIIETYRGQSGTGSPNVIASHNTSSSTIIISCMKLAVMSLTTYSYFHTVCRRKLTWTHVHTHTHTSAHLPSVVYRKRQQLSDCNNEVWDGKSLQHSRYTPMSKGNTYTTITVQVMSCDLSCDTLTIIKKQSQSHQYYWPAHYLVQARDVRVTSSPSKREDHRHAHYPHKPWEHQVSYSHSVPRTVAEEPISSTTIVDEYHHHQWKSTSERKYMTRWHIVYITSDKGPSVKKTVLTLEKCPNS